MINFTTINLKQMVEKFIKIRLMKKTFKEIKNNRKQNYYYFIIIAMIIIIYYYLY